MKLILEAIEKSRLEGLPALVLLAEQEKLLGNLPKDARPCCPKSRPS